MDDRYHYPADVFNLLVDTIPLLCKSKKDVMLFLEGDQGLHNRESPLRFGQQPGCQENAESCAGPRTRNDKPCSRTVSRRPVVRAVAQ